MLRKLAIKWGTSNGLLQFETPIRNPMVSLASPQVSLRQCETHVSLFMDWLNLKSGSSFHDLHQHAVSLHFNWNNISYYPNETQPCFIIVNTILLSDFLINISSIFQHLPTLKFHETACGRQDSPGQLPRTS